MSTSNTKQLVYKIRIIDWDKYQAPWKEGRAREYFSIHTKLFLDPEFFKLTSLAQIMWIRLLSTAAMLGTSTFDADLRLLRCTPHATLMLLRCSIFALNDIGYLEILDTPINKRKENKTSGGDESVQIDQNNSIPKDSAQPPSKKGSNPHSADFDAAQEFEAIYKRYPRKLGKARGIKRCRSVIRSEKTLADLKKAVDNFATHHENAQTEERFIPHFSTWMNETWRDWVETKPIKKKWREI